MTEHKFVATPLDQNMKLDVDSGTKQCEPTHNHQLVGSLIVLTMTRLDLIFGQPP